MSLNTLRDALVDEIRDLYNAEKQLTKALPKLAKAAASDELREAFESHLEETEGHITRLERVFELLDEKPRGKHCAGIAGIIEEGGAAIEESFDEATRDACLIAGGQRAEHYEISAYGTLIAWARTLEHEDAVELLERILDQEKAANEKLTELAEGGINDRAAQSAESDEEESTTPATRAPAPRAMHGAKATKPAK